MSFIVLFLFFFSFFFYSSLLLGFRLRTHSALFVMVCYSGWITAYENLLFFLYHTGCFTTGIIAKKYQGVRGMVYDYYYMAADFGIFDDDDDFDLLVRLQGIRESRS